MRVRALTVLLAGALASCELPPDRTGSCQGPMALSVGSFIRAEAFHDDCNGPDLSGDIFTLTLASQANLLLSIVPEGQFAPSMQIYRGTYGDADPPLVADLNTGTGVTLGVRTFLQPGSYFVVAGASTRTRASYRMTAAVIAGADCNYWNFITPGVSLDGSVSTADCPVISTIYSERFEMWREEDDSLNVTIIADSAGTFSFREACCEFATVFSQALEAGDSVTFGHRAPRRRPYRTQFQRDVGTLGPGSYRLRFH